jgi:hypothetical protein
MQRVPEYNSEWLTDVSLQYSRAVSASGKLLNYDMKIWLGIIL